MPLCSHDGYGTSCRQDSQKFIVARTTLSISCYFVLLSLFNVLPFASAFAPENLNVLKIAKQQCLSEDSYGMCPTVESYKVKISTWNTSSISTLLKAFEYNNDFDQPLADWDVSSVTSLESTFGHANALTNP